LEKKKRRKGDGGAHVFHNLLASAVLLFRAIEDMFGVDDEGLGYRKIVATVLYSTVFWEPPHAVIVMWTVASARVPRQHPFDERIDELSRVIHSPD
jgi:hypothetical protein